MEADDVERSGQQPVFVYGDVRSGNRVFPLFFGCIEEAEEDEPGVIEDS